MLLHFILSIPIKQQKLASAWPVCHTLTSILKNPYEPVVISERHVVKVSTPTLLWAYKAGSGIYAIHGELDGPEGEENLPSSPDKTGALSL